MREILFRGKTLDGGSADGWGIWYFGYIQKKRVIGGANWLLHEDLRTSTVYCRPVIVSPETVGQFTGLTDKNGKKIFEGDLIVYDYDEPDIDGSLHTTPCEVRYDAETASFLAVEKYSGKEDYTSLDGLPWRVVGNIYDNPELLEVKENV